MSYNSTALSNCGIFPISTPMVIWKTYRIKIPEIQSKIKDIVES